MPKNLSSHRKRCFRKAFHHETISYYRRTDREFVEIDEPCLSAVLSRTPKQISSLIPNAENGLFSRFIFYYMNMKVQWKDVLDENDEDGLHGYYTDLGKDLLSLYKALNEHPAIKFCVSPEQHAQFNVFFCDKGLISREQKGFYINLMISEK